MLVKWILRTISSINSQCYQHNFNTCVSYTEACVCARTELLSEFDCNYTCLWNVYNVRPVEWSIPGRQTLTWHGAKYADSQFRTKSIKKNTWSSGNNLTSSKDREYGEKHRNVYFGLSAIHPSITRRRTLGCINHCSSLTLSTVLCSEQKKNLALRTRHPHASKQTSFFFFFHVIPRANGTLKISQIYLSYVVEKAICH